MNTVNDPLNQFRARIWFSGGNGARKEHQQVKPEHSDVTPDLAFIRISELRRLCDEAETMGYDFVAVLPEQLAIKHDVFAWLRVEIEALCEKLARGQ